MLLRRNVIITIMQAFYEYLLLFPVILMIGIAIGDYIPLWLWCMTLLGALLIGVVYRFLFPKQKWWGMIGFSLVIGVAPSLIIDGDILLLILLGVLLPVLIYRGMMYASKEWSALLPMAFRWPAGFSAYFVSYFFFFNVELFNPYLTLLTIPGMVWIVATLFTSNNERLKTSTLSDKANPAVNPAIKKNNQVFMILTVLVIAILSIGDKVQQGLKSVVGWILRFLLESEEVEDEIVEEPLGPAMTPDQLFDEEPREPSIIWKVLETIMIYVIYAALAALAVVLILLFIKKSRTWLKKTFNRVLSFLKGIGSKSAQYEKSSAYVDEKENIFNWEDWKNEQQDKAKAFVKNIFKREPKWESLSNQQKVRFVYRHYVMREIHTGDFKEAHTPREALEQIKEAVATDAQLIDLLRDAYEQTRYGEKDLEDERTEKIHALIRKK